MDANDLMRLLGQELQPKPYAEVWDADAPIERMLVRPSRGGRYALAVAPWNATAAPTSQLGHVRQSVKAAFDASVFKGVGVIVLWYGPRDTWQVATEQIKPDKHGLRSVIIQGIIFVDLETGQSHVGQSSWGPIKFGSFQGQFARIYRVLEMLETGQAPCQTPK
ncbi:MAG: hypothetical protein ACYS8X_02610 [Planctomycetota bacterium]|jgi:hypothetical protein